jgi:hypothetical protein
MSDQTSNLPPPIPAESAIETKPRWSWWKITLAVIFCAVFVLKILGSYKPIELEVRRTGLINAATGNMIEVLNVGGKPITITNVTINERTDCRQNQKSESVTLKVGENTFFSGTCFIVRATIETSDGSASYSFSGN